MLFFKIRVDENVLILFVFVVCCCVFFGCVVLWYGVFFVCVFGYGVFCYVIVSGVFKYGIFCWYFF